MLTDFQSPVEHRHMINLNDLQATVYLALCLHAPNLSPMSLLTKSVVC